MKIKQDIQLSQNFWLNEFLSNNDRAQPNEAYLLNLKELAVYLQELRNIVADNTGITINSGFRGVDFNKSKPVGGSYNSYHLQGLAADIKFDFTGWARKSLASVLQYLGFTNVNFYWNDARTSWIWIHVDLGKTWNGEEFNYRDMDADTQKVITI